MTDTDVRQADAADRGAAVSALSSAFSTDPLITWMVRTPDPDRRRLEMMFETIVGAELTRPEPMVYVTADEAGAAVWHDVGQRGPSPAEMLRQLPSFVRVFRSGAVRALRSIAVIDKAHPTEPHRYLEFVGVHRDTQGTGHGSALLQHTLARCDAEGIPAYLENSNPANTAFYARHGFVQRGTIDLPRGAPPLVPMWREPRAT